MSNPLICNCRLKWLKQWLRSVNLAIGNPKCVYPEKLKDHSLVNSNELDFACADNDNDQECSGITEVKMNKLSFTLPNICPKNCSCSNNVVRCSHLNLKQIPNDIPLTVQEL